ncbi:hypothetical protein Q7C18_02850 [Nesterenkonia sp. CL21]|uniref:hypothetical protein n=1 Tax=Nesterenkonia sp. CL21 TaxID=3064894 RepID=UPI002878B836|nr:hypothetical protein [Nesterenkonia sp. CL21]MDS2171626.1 hypothetical protein [Nesterenkonia sp. CL21]
MNNAIITETDALIGKAMSFVSEFDPADQVMRSESEHLDGLAYDELFWQMSAIVTLMAELNEIDLMSVGADTRGDIKDVLHGLERVQLPLLGEFSRRTEREGIEFMSAALGSFRGVQDNERGYGTATWEQINW